MKTCHYRMSHYRMTFFPTRFFALAILMAGVLCGTEGNAIDQQSEDKIPDFTQGDSIPKGATHDWNLGPTGARGWIYSNKMETSEARQILVTSAESGSPADGQLEAGDVILGIGDRPFESDPRTVLGKAIGQAETADGRLTLMRWRNGDVQSVPLTLQVTGQYSATAPFDCPKSRLIFEQGCRVLARQMKSNPSRGNPIVRCLNALALLSSGRPEYLDLVREEVEWASTYSDLDRRTLHSWFYGPVNILLAEYSIATGDRQYLPALRRVTMEIVDGQSEVGSWGHRFIQPNGRLAGYGMMNAPGLPLTVSLVLAREAGIHDPKLDQAIQKSVGLLRFYVGSGSIPYGDHDPWIQTHDDNGKNGIAAVLFNLLGDAEAAEYFSHMSIASHGGERDTGHTGNFFNMLWAVPGIAVSGPQATGSWMQEFSWYYDLARQWDGTFCHQGPPAAQPDSYNGWDATGAYLLAYAQPLRKIYLTGKKTDVALQLDSESARSFVDAGRDWSPRLRIAPYHRRSDEQLIEGLASWSPVVRERSAMAIAERRKDLTARIIPLLETSDLNSRLGACQALFHLKDRGAEAVPMLRSLLNSDDLWLRIKAAEALAGIGEAATPAIPEMLTMMTRENSANDPRGMQQRYLCFALFDQRSGLLSRYWNEFDRKLLLRAVDAGLGNQDGRARGALAPVFQKLTFEEIKPLLPAVHQAIIEPAPSGIMFADGIRLSGLELLAKHNIREGVPLCITLIEPERWGANGRISRCLAVLEQYGGAARSEIPRLHQLEKQLSEKGWKPDAIDKLGIADLVRTIENSPPPNPMQTLTTGS